MDLCGVYHACIQRSIWGVHNWVYTGINMGDNTNPVRHNSAIQQTQRFMWRVHNGVTYMRSIQGCIQGTMWGNIQKYTWIYGGVYLWYILELPTYMYHLRPLRTAHTHPIRHSGNLNNPQVYITELYTIEIA